MQTGLLQISLSNNTVWSGATWTVVKLQEGFIYSKDINVASDQTVQIHMLIWCYSFLIWHDDPFVLACLQLDFNPSSMSINLTQIKKWSEGIKSKYISFLHVQELSIIFFPISHDRLYCEIFSCILLFLLCMRYLFLMLLF